MNPTATAHPPVLSATSLVGDGVVNLAGENLGEIKELMFDIESGRIAYAVLSFGGFLGLGDKLFAIPWSTLRLDGENHRFILDVEKERLKEAPGFDKDHWPQVADRRWGQEIHTFYQQKPYWEY